MPMPPPLEPRNKCRLPGWTILGQVELAQDLPRENRAQGVNPDLSLKHLSAFSQRKKHFRSETLPIFGGLVLGCIEADC